MNTPGILLAGTAGTSLMTAFSYQVSKEKQEQFREPLLLHKLISRLLPSDKKYNTTIDGWILHYSVGLMFNVIYDALWKNSILKPSIGNGLAIGTASGILGASVWTAILKLHPNPPVVNIRKYYPHLIAAHMVFGLFSVLGYRAAKPNGRIKFSSDTGMFFKHFRG
jgi:hypothetical protein